MSMNKNIEIDTSKLGDTVEVLEQDLLEYENKINSFFKKLDFVNYNDVWIGETAKVYSNLALERKLDYISYGEGLKDLVKKIQSFYTDLETQTKENEDICEHNNEISD